MKKSSFSGRSYTWSLISYAPITNISQLLNECKHWAWCFHDKDIDENGKLKEFHTHIICTFDNQISLETIRKIIDSNQNTFGECRRKCGDEWIPLNIPSLFDYLIHKGYDDKYQYDETERHIDSISYWSRYDRDSKPTNDDFISDLLAPYKSDYEMNITMSRKYGRDFIRNHKSYMDFRYNILNAQKSGEEKNYENICNKETFGENE